MGLVSSVAIGYVDRVAELQAQVAKFRRANQRLSSQDTSYKRHARTTNAVRGKRRDNVHTTLFQYFMEDVDSAASVRVRIGTSHYTKRSKLLDGRVRHARNNLRTNYRIARRVNARSGSAARNATTIRARIVVGIMVNSFEFGLVGISRKRGVHERTVCTITQIPCSHVYADRVDDIASLERLDDSY